MANSARESAPRGSLARTAVTYARVSSKEQDKEGYSIPAQLKLLRHYAATGGFTVVREFVETETAKRAGRTAFGQMVHFLEDHRDCSTLIVEKTDRLYRNFRDYLTLDDLDLEIHFVKEGDILSRNSHSSKWTMHEIKVALARGYVRNLGEETSKGMEEKAEEGMWPSYAPLGYTNRRDEQGRKVIVPDPECAPAIAKLFQWYAGGDFSLKDVTRMAREAGLRSRRSLRPVPKSTIHKTLRNPIYYGDFRWRGKLLRGVHTPLVSRELWDQVQHALAGRSVTSRHRQKHNFAFSGLVKCGHCGCALVGQIQKQKYTYYHCSGYKGNCGEPYVPQQVLEEAFAELLRGLVFDAEVVNWISEALRDNQRDKRREQAEASKRMRSEYDNLETRIDRMYDDKLDGKIEDAYFARRSAEARHRQSEILREMERQRRASEVFVEDGIRILELARGAYELFTRQTPAEKRRLLQHLLSNCTWQHGALQVEYRQPFGLLAVAATRHRKQKAAGAPPDDLSANWHPQRDSNPCCRRERAVS